MPPASVMSPTSCAPATTLADPGAPRRARSGPLLCLLLAAAPLLRAAESQEPLRVRPDHPRLFLCRENLEAYRARMKAHPAWAPFRAKAEKGGMVEAAFCYQMTQEKRFADLAAAALASEVEKPRPDLKALALAFDWACDALPEPLRDACVAKMASLVSFGRLKGLDAWQPPTKPLFAWTFHSEEWCGTPPVDHYVLAALAHHHPKAEPAYVAIWEKFAWKDACDLLDYLQDGSWSEGGYWVVRGKLALMFKPFLVLKSATGRDYFSGEHRYLNRVGYFVLYQSDPYLRKLWNTLGDACHVPLDSLQHRHNMLLAASQARNPYFQWFLKQACGYQPEGTVDDLLFYDPTVPAKPPAEGLPPARLFTGMNLAITRSDWSKDAMAVSFVNRDYYDCHHHFDNGSFIVYKAGAAQVPDSGIYDSFGVPHYYNYYLRTVAHNTLLVHDPSERIRYYLHEADPSVERDGGQRYPGRAQTFAKFLRRMPETDLGDILAYRDRPLYTYVVGDATRAYAPAKLREFTRSLLFLRPRTLVVFDRVETTDASFRKRWLLHLEGEPAIDGEMLHAEVKGHIETYDGGLARAVHPANGQVLACRTLLPAERRITKIGGALPEAARWKTTVLKKGVFAVKDIRVNYPPLYLEGRGPLAAEPRDEALIRFMWERGTLSSLEITVDDTGVAFKHTGCRQLKVPPKALRIDYAAAPTLGGLVAALNREFKGSYWKAALVAGYRWWNEGRNYALWGSVKQDLFRRATGGYKDLAEEISAGHWRIEVSPAQPARRDCFLHLIHLPDRDAQSVPEVAVTQDEGRARLEFADGGRRYQIAFAQAGEPACSLVIQDGDGRMLVDEEIGKEIDLAGQP